MISLLRFSLSAIMVVSGQERTPATVALTSRRECVGNVAGENFAGEKVANAQVISANEAASSAANPGSKDRTAGTLKRPRSNFLTRLATRESRNNDGALGDFDKMIGEFMSRGRWQISEAAWVDVSSDRRRAGLRSYPWRTHAHVEAVAREYAHAYLALLAHQFRSSHGRSPTEREMMSLWRHGYDGHRRLKLARNPLSK